jgi:nitrate/nitrite-specific signal transduction histidine kinase
VRIRSLFLLLFGILFALVTGRSLLTARLFSAAMAEYDLRLAHDGGVDKAVAFVRYQQDLTRQTIWFAALTGVVIVAMGVVVVVLIARPLAELVEHARRVGQGDFHSIEVRGVAEVTALGRAANQMVERLAAERSRERSLTEKASALARELSEKRASLEKTLIDDGALRRALARANEELQAHN